MGDLNAEAGARPDQRGVAERRAVIDEDPGRDGAGGQRGPQRPRQRDDALRPAPAPGHDGAAVVVDEAEQVAFAALDHRAVQRVAGPQVVRARRLEGPERRGGAAGAGQLEPAEVTLQRLGRRGPAARGDQDPADLLGGAGRHLRLQRRCLLQDLRVGPRGDLAGRRGQRGQPAGPVGAQPPLRRRTRHPPRVPEAVRGRLGDDPAHHRAALPPGQGRAGCLLDRQVPPDALLPGALAAPAGPGVDAGHLATSW
jgi:hypothetical protein